MTSSRALAVSGMARIAMDASAVAESQAVFFIASSLVGRSCTGPACGCKRDIARKVGALRAEHAQGDNGEARGRANLPKGDDKRAQNYSMRAEKVASSCAAPATSPH